MKVFLFVSFIFAFCTSYCQLTNSYTLPGDYLISIHIDHDSLTFTSTDPKGVSKVFYYGQFATDSLLFGRASFIIKKNGKLLKQDYSLTADSILIISVPDWNDRFFLFRFQKTTSGYIPILNTEKRVDYLAIIKTPYIFVNHDQNYIVNFIRESNEFFYANSNLQYVQLDLININQVDNQLRNIIRMDQRYFIKFFKLEEKNYAKFIRKVIRKTYIPW